jgi:hypothetical protein
MTRKDNYHKIKIGPAQIQAAVLRRVFRLCVILGAARPSCVPDAYPANLAIGQKA